MKIPKLTCGHPTLRDDCDQCWEARQIAEDRIDDPMAQVWLAVMECYSAADQCAAVYEVLNKNGWPVS